MDVIFISSAKASVLGITTVVFSILISLIGLGFLAFIVNKRLIPLKKAASGPRMDLE